MHCALCCVLAVPDAAVKRINRFAAAVADLSDSTKLKAEYDLGDGLHPSVQGRKVMGDEAIRRIKELIKLKHRQISI